MKKILVVIPCGKSKVWDKDPNRGQVSAFEAYIGAPFKVNREYAEYFADSWVILSAKYGFIQPNFMIPGRYNVTFKDKSTNPITISTLQKQIQTLDIDRFDLVIGLGGKEYRAIMERVFSTYPVQVRFPFAGLRSGKTMNAIKRAIESGVLFPKLDKNK